jgi:RimJ/RimL family protein N-acetyltransferase
MGDNSVPFLEGKKIVLCPLREEDLDFYTKMLNRQDVATSLLAHDPLTIPREREILGRLARLAPESGVVLGIWTREHPQRLLGNVGLHDIHARDRHAWMGIFIGEPTEWGKGYAKEAMRLVIEYGFYTRNLRKVWLNVYSDNERAIRLYQSLGFKEVGRALEHRFALGRWRDELTMELFRRDYIPIDGSPFLGLPSSEDDK